MIVFSMLHRTDKTFFCCPQSGHTIGMLSCNKMLKMSVQKTSKTPSQQKVWPNNIFPPGKIQTTCANICFASYEATWGEDREADLQIYWAVQISWKIASSWNHCSMRWHAWMQRKGWDGDLGRGRQLRSWFVIREHSDFSVKTQHI